MPLDCCYNAALVIKQEEEGRRRCILLGRENPIGKIRFSNSIIGIDRVKF